MKLKISEKHKKDIFLSIFNILKTCTSIITMIYKPDELYIQGMDKAHVCLFEVKLKSDWFYEYEQETTETICVDSHMFYNILSIVEESQILTLHYEFEEQSDKLNINFTSDNKSVFDKFFNIPLADVDSLLLEIPDVNYDAEFSIKAKKICDITCQLLLFGDIMKIKCDEEDMFISCEGVSGEMTVKISIDDLIEYSISEGETIDISYSLTYLSKMCMTTKLTNEIYFSVSSEYPLKIKYDLTNGSQVLLFIAPKIE